MYIRKDDVVEVVTGDDKGTRGKVLKVLRGRDQVVVEGINRVYRHLKPSRRNPQGGRLSKEMPIDASNVLPYCSTCRHGVRVGHRYDAVGSKERYCKKCRNSLGKLSKPRSAYAHKW